MITRLATQDDTVVLLFSGQGTTIDNNFYFFPYDVKVDVQASVKASAISATELRSEIAKVRSRRILIDFCPSS